MEFFNSFDLIYCLILLLVVPPILTSRAEKKYGDKFYFKYYRIGLYAKTFGAIAFCSIYAFYYGGGDTTNYFKGVSAMIDVAIDSPMKYLKLLTLDTGKEMNRIFYNVGSFPPYYMLKDPRTMTVIKVTSVFGILGFRGFLSTTLLLSLFTFSWVWKLYSFMCERYPNSIPSINIAILFLPSTLFWGSGIMKDTYAFGATCFSVYGLHNFFIEKKRLVKTLVQLFFSLYLIITIKSYILFALLPGLLIFANFERLKKIQSNFVKITILPFSFLIIFLVANTLFFDFNELFGRYSAENLLEEAAVQNADLKRDVYGSNSFDIGEFEPTLQGVTSKFFPAVNAALFRPYIWESGSPTMIFSGLENLIILLTFVLVVISNPLRFLSRLKNDPFLIFCFLFTLTLGFGVGLSTSNFGALVRYKIPFLPFFWFLILSNINRLKKINSV